VGATPGTKEVRGRRRVCRVDRRDNRDIVIAAPGNLRFHAKLFIYRASAFFHQRSHRRHQGTRGPVSSVISRRYL